MQIFCRNSLICLLVISIPATVNAMKSMKQGDAVITVRNGNPCFSYPQDKEIQKRPYSFAHLSVSRTGPLSDISWEIQIKNSDRKGLLEPDTPETCIKYGAIHPGTEGMVPAKPLLIDIPYSVLLRVSTRVGEPYHARRYLSEFCVSCDKKGNPTIVGTDWDDETHVMKCLKPSESPKRSFWQKLFGK